MNHEQLVVDRVGVEVVELEHVPVDLAECRAQLTVGHTQQLHGRGHDPDAHIQLVGRKGGAGGEGSAHIAVQLLAVL